MTTKNIVLCTMNARYSHTAFALRYLYANLGTLQPQAEVLEFTIKTRALDVVEAIVARNPKIVGFSVYLWNTALTLEIVQILKRLSPSLKIVVGGPEVSHETAQPLCGAVDYVVKGEGEDAFSRLCRQVLSGLAPAPGIIEGGEPDIETLTLPYTLYTDDDLKNRVVYVEASRGCPFKCAFCLSALDERVRLFPQDAFLAEMEQLLARGARVFKFIDRTFNLNLRVAERILTFFLDRYVDGLFLHFEAVPDRLPARVLELLARFPDGAVQLEIGVQTLNDDVAETISRRLDVEKTLTNLNALRTQTGVHIHVDLIAGLPGEDRDSFAAGLETLLGAGPQEIQLGILKRLRGSPLTGLDEIATSVFSATAPYEVLRTDAMSFEELATMRRAAQVFDAVHNRGNLQRTKAHFFARTPFARLWALTERLVAAEGRVHSTALDVLAGHLFDVLRDEGEDPALVAAAILDDFTRIGHKRIPKTLEAHVPELADRFAEVRGMPPIGAKRRHPMKRQDRHLPATTEAAS